MLPNTYTIGNQQHQSTLIAAALCCDPCRNSMSCTAFHDQVSRRNPTPRYSSNTFHLILSTARNLKGQLDAQHTLCSNSRRRDTKDEQRKHGSIIRQRTRQYHQALREPVALRGFPPSSKERGSRHSSKADSLLEDPT